AAASATRQLGSYERLVSRLGKVKAGRPREIAMHLWKDVRSAEIDHATWSKILGEVMNLIPEENDDWTGVEALADDAVSSLAYAIRCLLTRSSQEAVWAARRAYEAADQAAIRTLGVQPEPHTEETIKAHTFVQRELARQRNDLSLLADGST